MTDRMDHLERLVSLRDSGALTEDEFQREKALVIAGGLSGAPGSPHPAPARRFGFWTIAVPLALGLAAAVGIVLARWSTADFAGGKSVAAPAAKSLLSTPAASVSSIPQTSLRQSLSPSQQAQRAFDALFGDGPPKIRTSNQIDYTYKAGKLAWAAFGPVLVLPADNLAEPSPVSIGALGIFYLKEENGAFRVVRRWPDAIDGSIMGNPPAWKFVSGLGPNPVIVATGGGVWQGYRCESTTVTELRPSGPVTVASFSSVYENGGAVEDPERVESITGEIINMRQNSFDVRFRGTRNFMHHYVRKGEVFVRPDPAGDQELPGC